MNAKQRMKNRDNALKLKRAARDIELSKHICENCGEPGGHWIVVKPTSLFAMVSGLDDQQGFWTCAKYYGEDERRLEGC